MNKEITFLLTVISFIFLFFVFNFIQAMTLAIFCLSFGGMVGIAATENARDIMKGKDK